MEGLGGVALITREVIGIDLAAARWKAVHLKKGLSGITPVEHLTFEGELSERLFSLKGYLKRSKLADDALALALPSADCLVKVLSLPSADRKALSGILVYELERHLPAGPEAWRFSHSVVKNEGAASVIMLNAAKAAAVELVNSMFEPAGLKPSFMTSGQGALAKAALDSVFLKPEVLSAIASVNVRGFSLDFFKNGVLVYSSMGAKGAARLETGLALSFLKELPEDFIVIDEDASDGTGDALEEMKGAAMDVCGAVQLFGPVPAFSRAFGAALMALDNKESSANLVASTTRSASREKVLGVAAASMLAVLTAGAAVAVNDTLDIRKTEKEIALLGGDRVKAQAAMREVEAMTADIKILEELKGAGSPGFLDMLSRLTELTPEDTYLTGLEYGKESISVDGSSQKASGLFMKLSRSGLAEEIRYDGPVVRGQDGRERFRIRFKPSGGQGNADDNIDS